VVTGFLFLDKATKNKISVKHKKTNKKKKKTIIHASEILHIKMLKDDKTVSDIRNSRCHSAGLKYEL
jgi:hypothetical protein